MDHVCDVCKQAVPLGLHSESVCLPAGDHINSQWGVGAFAFSRQCKVKMNMPQTMKIPLTLRRSIH